MGDFSAINGIKKDTPFLSLHKKGQAIVELLLVLPILLLLIIGSVEVGRIYFAKIVITNAAREGAYYLSSNSSDYANFSGTYRFSNTRQIIKNESNNSGVVLSDSMISITCTANFTTCSAGQPAIVTINTSVANVYVISLLKNSLAIKLSKNTFAISSSAQMVVQ
jgi:Flp pilus assembly protein TadG